MCGFKKTAGSMFSCSHIKNGGGFPLQAGVVVLL